MTSKSMYFGDAIKYGDLHQYQVDFLLPLKLQKISYYFGLCRKIDLANQFEGFFTFDLCDLLILMPGVHCYIVLV